MVDMNRSATNRGNASHQEIESSQKKILLFFPKYWKKVNKTRQT